MKSLFNFFYFVTDYASTAGTTETDLLSLRPTLKHTVPSTKAKRVWSRPIPMFHPDGILYLSDEQ